MRYKIITDKARLEVFEYFNNFFYPFSCVNFEINITKLKYLIKVRKLKFSSPVLFILLQSCNEINEFKRRILESSIIEYDKVAISFPHLNKNNQNQLTFHKIDYTDSFEHFNKKYLTIINDTFSNRMSPINQSDNMILTSNFPWFSLKCLISPVKSNKIASPQINWSRAYEDFNKQIMLPISITTHHALVDGIHLALLNESIINNISKFITDKDRLFSER